MKIFFTRRGARRTAAGAAGLYALMFFWSCACLCHAQPSEEKYKLAEEYFAQGDYPKAIQEYEALSEKDLKYPQMYNNLGLAYLRSGKSFVKAVENFRKAIELNSNYSEAYANLGLAYIGKEDYPSAIKSFEDLLAINSDYAQGYFGLGWAYLLGNADSVKALKAFEKAIYIDPGLAEAYLGLGLAFIAQGQKQLALEPITTLRRNRRDDLANMLESATRTPEAFQESVKKGPLLKNQPK